MLALKAMIAERHDLPTIILDEIDTGVSGEIARRMAEMMRGMVKGGKCQVITITHLPQIASMGEKHYFVYKQDTETATTTHIRALTTAERTEEIARMLSGKELTAAALDNAKELLKL